jgi:hypothetical protein
LGLLGYAIGALAMTLAQGLTAVIIFRQWWVALLVPILAGLVGLFNSFRSKG